MEEYKIKEKRAERIYELAGKYFGNIFRLWERHVNKLDASGLATFI